MKKLYKISLINIEWNSCNGFCLEILGIDYHHFDRCLFAFWTNWKDHIVIDFLFLQYNSRRT